MAKFNLGDIKNKNDFPAVLLLYGADTFTMDETLEKITKFLIVTENDKIDFEIIDGEEAEQNAIINIAAQLPMLSERRVVVVKRFDKIFKERRKKSDTVSPFAKYLENANHTTSLILTVDASENKLDITKFPYDIITKKHHTVEFPAVYENQLAGWVVKRFSQAGKNINLETAELIVSQTPANLRSLANEVEKICLYEPETKNITFDYVLNIIGSSRQNTVFELTNAVAQRDSKKAIKIMLNILATSSQEILIITLLRDLFIKLWKLVELSETGATRDEMAKQIGLRNAYFLNDYLIGIKRYSLEDINNAFLIICETDQRIKSTNSNSKLIIEEMLIKITNI
jgi:DNA polymerase-3 subunit delta